jgi:SAM-dependent methyltransferase
LRETIAAPDPLVVRFASGLRAGTALDLACGSGRHAVWLAKQGWTVTAVDVSSSAIAILQERDASVDTRVADLTRGEFTIEASAYDLVLISRYLQRDLFEPAKRGVKPGGVLIAIVLLENPAEEPGRFRAKPGELRSFFDGWEILHSYEGPSPDHWVAEIAARLTPAS